MPALSGKTEGSGLVQPGEESTSVGSNSLLIPVHYKHNRARLFTVVKGLKLSQKRFRMNMK